MIFSLLVPYYASANFTDNTIVDFMGEQEELETTIVSSGDQEITTNDNLNEEDQLVEQTNSQEKENVIQKTSENDDNTVRVPESLDEPQSTIIPEVNLNSDPQDTSTVGKRSAVELTPKEINSTLSVDDKQNNTEIEEEVQTLIADLPVYEEVTTSRLGHFRNGNVKIYKNIGNHSTSFTAGATYTNAVYYIKKQADVEGEIYYLLSTQPSSERGVLGWVKATDLTTHPHVEIDKEAKTFIVKGTGSGYSKAWGGKKDFVFENLSEYVNQYFQVNLTEKVGNDIWYRGKLGDKTVWIHSSDLVTNRVPIGETSSTSRLGHFRNGSVKIYGIIGNESSSFTAGSTYTNAVYYIKKQARISGQHYYLLSTEPSSERGVLGWVKASDLTTEAHLAIDKGAKTFYIKGTGSSYSKAWGGKKDWVQEDLTEFQNQQFLVHLTEKVGNDIWYRGTLDGKTVWIHPNHLTTSEETTTSRLGHFRNGSALIYKTVGEESTAISAGATYTNAVYYIKLQKVVNGHIYYLLSTQPSSERGVLGWVKAKDLSTHPHVTIDKDAKTFYIRGTGSAYSKAWGGKKDFVLEDLSRFQDQEFKVHLTEKVGNVTWYRGTLEGKTVWIQPKHLSVGEDSITSLLGHFRNGSSLIYENIADDSTAFAAGSTYTNAVYYIKKQTVINGHTYYLLSTQPSSERGVVGWVKESDLSIQPHKYVNSTAMTFYIKGTGSAYTKAWGGKKDFAYSDLSTYKHQKFQVHLTEKVGNSLWYRGTLDGKTVVWVHESYLIKPKDVVGLNTHYDLSLNRMLEIQLAVNPQTDKRYNLWLREDALKVNEGKGTVVGDNWNLRRGPGTNYRTDGQVNKGTVLTLYSSTKGSDGYIWYHVRNTSGWVTAESTDVKYYLDYSNFTGNLADSLQFLILSESANINVNEVNEKVLRGKGTLEGKAQAFVDAGKLHGVNEIYLISHALLETGHGKGSPLATGIQVGKNSQGSLVLVSNDNRSSLKEIKTVYNMYGINAKDACPLECGAKYAYEANWFTPEAAIKGGAAFIGDGYVNKGQNTLYKMRWNPYFAASNNYASHQYASDIGWAYKQTSNMYNIYSLLDDYFLVLDIPVYK